MAFGQLCAPALIYIVFSITQVTMDSLKGMHNVAFVKLFISILFTILLNHLCQRGLGIVSWVIVFIPFMLMSVIVGLLLLVLGLDPKTGKLMVERNEKEQKKPDARADAIRNYTMTRTKRDYMKRMGDLGYLGLDEKGSTTFPKNWDEDKQLDNDTGGNVPYLRQHPKITIRWLVFAEEFTKAINHHLNNNSWRWDNTLSGNVSKERAKEIFEKNNHVAAKLYFMDFLYKQKNEKVLKGEQPIDEEAEAMKEFLIKLKKDNFTRGTISTLGPIKHVDGYNYGTDVFHVEIFKRLRDSLYFDEGDDTDWIRELIKKYKTRVKRYENSEIPVWDKALNDLIRESIDRNAQTNKYPSGINSINELWDKDLDEAKKRISDAIIDVLNNDLDWISPEKCGDSPELLKQCKSQIGENCKPCNIEDIKITTGENRDLELACPYGCDPEWSTSGDMKNRKKLCEYCNLCGGTKINNVTKKFVPLGDFKKEQSCNPSGNNAETYNKAWDMISGGKYKDGVFPEGQEKAPPGENIIEWLDKQQDDQALKYTQNQVWAPLYPKECSGVLCPGEDNCKKPDPFPEAYKITKEPTNWSHSNWSDDGDVECSPGYEGKAKMIKCSEANGEVTFDGCTKKSG